MRICILATNENVEELRVKTRELVPEFADHRNLTIPCSETGDFPATHWFCTFTTDEESANKLLALQQLSDMALSEIRPFLMDRDLKLIKLKKIIRANRRKNDAESDESEVTE